MILSTKALAEEISEAIGESPTEMDSGRLLYEKPTISVIVHLNAEKLSVSVSWTAGSTWEQIAIFDRDQEQPWVVGYLVGILL